MLHHLGIVAQLRHRYWKVSTGTGIGGVPEFGLANKRPFSVVIFSLNCDANPPQTPSGKAHNHHRWNWHAGIIIPYGLRVVL
jgi:hypothetical protein